MTNPARYGAKVLDRVMPQLGVDDWWNTVSIKSLNLKTMSDCVLGQLFANYSAQSTGFDTVKSHLKNVHGVERAWSALDRCGFSSAAPNPDVWESLRKGWIAEIRQRRTGQLGEV